MTTRPLSIKPLALRLVILFAVVSILVSIIKFFLTKFTPNDPTLTENFATVLSFIRIYLNPITLWLRVIVLLFSIYATVIYILNPHPHTRHAVILSWLSAFLSFAAVLFL